MYFKHDDNFCLAEIFNKFSSMKNTIAYSHPSWTPISKHREHSLLSNVNT